MKLPLVSSLFKKTPPKEYFLAFLLRDEQVHAVVFEQVAGRIQVIGQGKALLSQSLESISSEQLLQAADRAISIAEEPLPSGIQTHKTIFGVKGSWVEGDHIKTNYLDVLKSFSKELELQPIGFLVFSEAIAHLLQKEEGAPVSAVLLDAGEHFVGITLIRAGRIVATKELPIEEDLLTTVDRGLRHFENVEILPSRIILFETQDNTLEKKFLHHQWSKTLPFLHVPQITVLPHDFDTRAILFGTATQMGFDAIDLVKESLRTSTPVSPMTANEKESSEESEKPESLETSEELESPEKPQSPKEGADERQDPEVKEESSEFFGFVKDDDIAQNPVEKSSLPEEEQDEITEEIPEVVKEEESVGPIGFSLQGPAFVEGAKKMLKQLKHARMVVPFFRNIQTMLPPLSSQNKLIFLIPGGIGLILVCLLWYIFGLHATATISLTPKTLEQKQNVTFSANDPTDIASNVIAAHSLSVSEDGSTTANATGSKDVGDKAKGSVTIFNNNDTSKSLDSGTTITSENGLKFTLDSDVTVASATGDIFSGTKPGTATVNVTASDIGTDYNLPSGTKFSINGSSTMAAKNDNAFSGGSKKTVTVVSQKDVDNLDTTLIKNLSDKAKQDIQKQLSSDEVMLSDFTKTSVSNDTTDKKVGDSATSVTLHATANYQTIVYKKTDIKAFSDSVMKGQITDNLTLAPEGITFGLSKMTVDKGSITAALDMKASLVPKLDTKEIAQQIAGKPFNQAREIVSGIPQFSDVIFKLSPNLFFLPQTLPRLSENISIVLSAQ